MDMIWFAVGSMAALSAGLFLAVLLVCLVLWVDNEVCGMRQEVVLRKEEE